MSEFDSSDDIIDCDPEPVHVQRPPIQRLQRTSDVNVPKTLPNHVEEYRTEIKQSLQHIEDNMTVQQIPALEEGVNVVLDFVRQRPRQWAALLGADGNFHTIQDADDWEMLAIVNEAHLKLKTNGHRASDGQVIICENQEGELCLAQLPQAKVTAPQKLTRLLLKYIPPTLLRTEQELADYGVVCHDWPAL
eukprot:TRINITY_DN53944_c0_g1_i1.p1 TRINITY_DN53944_c0_g1~~TRINITY_DN53944_c0_g1_i1.p1  ORF type:complete len:191 (-),score=10.09 TRINITY_DN53944_c0_g1_i1:179-751(-)